MDHTTKRKKHEKRKNCTGYCPIALGMLTQRAYAKGYQECHDKMIDRMLNVITTTFTVIGTIVNIVALVGVVLRVLIRRCTKQSRYLTSSRVNFYYSF